MAKTDAWYMERIIWLIAGCFTLASAILAWFHSLYWLFFTGLVGVNLIIFGLTGFCLMANILYTLGARSAIKPGTPGCVAAAVAGSGEDENQGNAG
ncbi:MAG: DUF2892 domain-containing protein [bacterium]|nr:DUF2892 domain-containing protein [bacterium]